MERLVKLARKALESVFEGIEPPLEYIGKKGGVFVTLKYPDGRLRGCMGVLEEGDVGINTVRAALLSAFEDPRFPPLQEGELDKIVVEVSVLSPFKRSSIEEIEVGKHGVVVEYGDRRALLLPQVAIEEGMNREEFLMAACLKAGLSENCYKYANIYTFTAEVYSELYPKGPVVKVMGDEAGR